MQILILKLTGKKKKPSQGLSNNKPLFGNKSVLMNVLLKKCRYLDIKDFLIGFLIIVLLKKGRYLDIEDFIIGFLIIFVGLF